MNLLIIFWTSLKLGLTSFGGPTAHLGFFQQTYIEKKKWLSASDYANLVALAQFLPGPTSSQVGFSIGFKQKRLLGAIVSFIGFTLPSAVFLMLFALWVKGNASATDLSWLTGLKLVSIIIIWHAIYTMSKGIIKTKRQLTVAIFTAIVLLFINIPFIHVLTLFVVFIIGLLLKAKQAEKTFNQPMLLSKKMGAFYLALFGLLFVLLPILSKQLEHSLIQLVDVFYRTGTLVFGGGHVILPLLQNELVETNLVSEHVFLAGYGITQAMPGPLFTFASYLGTITEGVLGGVLATIAIFLPGFLLLLGVLPFWQHWLNNPKLSMSFQLMNAAVIGLLFATFITPILTNTIDSLKNACFLALLSILYFAMKSSLLLVGAGLIVGLLFY